MNDVLLSMLLGVVEGLTEFLPVSSTAHLRIAEALVGVNLADGYWKMFAIVIQLGAVACLPLYFRVRLLDFLAGLRLEGPRGWRRHPFTLTLVAFVCTAVPSLLLVKLIGKHLESLGVMAGSLIVGGVAMWVVDELSARDRPPVMTVQVERMSLRQAIWIGLCQTLAAVFPGTSRSMATITAGQLVGMSRGAALEFSFFLSMPTMLAATLYDLYKTIRHGADGAPLGAVHMTAHGWLVLGIGFAVSFVVAWACVAWFMRWVRHRGFAPFAAYRLVVGALVLVWVLRGGA